jgi:hypothetical protein
MTREPSVATLKRLAEAFDRHPPTMPTPAQKEALAAYRSEIAPLRTETQVVLDIGHHVRACVRLGQVMMTAEEQARLEDLANEQTAPRSSSGPSSADAEEVPSPRPPASPAGADLLDENEIAQMWALSRTSRLQHFEARTLQKLLRAYSALTSGSPGAVAAKESRDNAAAPEGAALEDPEPCGCEETETLKERIAAARLFVQQSPKIGWGLAAEIIRILNGEP